MDVYQRAWASLLERIEAKTSWGRNELKQAMLEALVEAAPKETSWPTDKDFRVPKEVDYSASAPYADADAVQRKAQHEEFAGLMDDISSSDINPEDLSDV